MLTPDLGVPAPTAAQRHQHLPARKRWSHPQSTCDLHGYLEMTHHFGLRTMCWDVLGIDPREMAKCRQDSATHHWRGLIESYSSNTWSKSIKTMCYHALKCVPSTRTLLHTCNNHHPHPHPHPPPPPPPHHHHHHHHHHGLIIMIIMIIIITIMSMIMISSGLSPMTWSWSWSWWWWWWWRWWSWITYTSTYRKSTDMAFQKYPSTIPARSNVRVAANVF